MQLSFPSMQHPVVGQLDARLGEWIRQRFGALTPAQEATLPEILARRSVVLSAPTGTGKTLAAFLGVFDWLLRADGAGELGAGVQALYVSPLRALAYDIQKNLEQPLREMGLEGRLRIGMRTGDTSARERAAMRRKPPHILATTPESLALLLSQATYREALGRVRFLIVDELHALAENKRGVHLMVLVEQLEEWTAGQGGMVRVGLSATVRPLARMGQFLTGGRDCALVEVAGRRGAVIEVYSPLRRNPYPAAGYTAGRLMKELAGLVREHRTTLLFTNTRGGAESIGLKLKEELPELESQVAVHHASLDRALRLEVEDRLKAGELRAVVCSATLEMGIDIGSVDLVVLISAPKGVARALQRLGRSGHSIHEVSHGVLVATNVNDLVECAVTARLMEARELEPLRVPELCLDVLAQVVVGLVVMGPRRAGELLGLVRRAHPYRELEEATFHRVLHYLCGGGRSLEGRYEENFGKIVWDRERDEVRLRSPRVRREYWQNVGTIVSEGMVRVRLGRKVLGQVEEAFAQRLRLGDVFVLSAEVVRLCQVRVGELVVERARGLLPTVPRWNANKMPLASGLAREVIRLRTAMAGLWARLGEGAAFLSQGVEWLVEEYGVSASNAEAIVRQCRAQARVSRIPTAEFLLVERFREGELVHYFVHALIGRTGNDALSRIVAGRLSQRRGGNALVTVDDYGFLLTVPGGTEIAVGEWRELCQPDGAAEELVRVLRESELVKWQFRGVAQTGLMVPRQVAGAERRPRALQWNSELLFRVLMEHEPEHPLLTEAFHAATHQFLDLPRALEFMREAQELRWESVEVERVSPFAFGIFVSKIKERMNLEDQESAVERLFHAMYAELEREDEGGGAGMVK